MVPNAYFHLGVSKSIGSFSVLFAIPPFTRIDIFIRESVESFSISFSCFKLTYSGVYTMLSRVQYHNTLLYPCKLTFQCLLYCYFSNLRRRNHHSYNCIFLFHVLSIYQRALSGSESGKIMLLLS